LHSNELPVAQIALLLGVPEQDLRALLAARNTSPGDPTLVALTVEEAARRLGVGRTTMYALLASGEVPSVTIGRLRRVPAEALAEYVAARTQPTRSTVALTA
jgi:excisionase family DNA binding protein